MCLRTNLNRDGSIRSHPGFILSFFLSRLSVFSLDPRISNSTPLSEDASNANESIRDVYEILMQEYTCIIMVHPSSSVIMYVYRGHARKTYTHKSFTDSGRGTVCAVPALVYPGWRFTDCPSGGSSEALNAFIQEGKRHPDLPQHYWLT